MTAEKISKTLFSLYPFFYNFKDYSDIKIKFRSNNSIIINDTVIKNINTSKFIVDLISSINLEISDDIKINNKIYIFQQFIHNFINIIVFEYKELKDLFKIIYNIYYNYILNKVNTTSLFISIYKNLKNDQSVVDIIKEIYGFKYNLSIFNECINRIINYKIPNEQLLYKSLFPNDISIIPLYIFNDFIKYLSIIYKELLKELEDIIITFSEQIEIYNNGISTAKFKQPSTIQFLLKNEIIDNIKGLNVKDLREKQDIKIIYKKAELFISNYIDSNKSADTRYDKIKALSEKDKKNLKLSLANFFYLLDSNKGKWKEDIGNADDYYEKLKQLQYDYENILQLLDYTKVEIKEDYFELYNIYEKLKKIASLIKYNKRISQEDYDLISNFDSIIKDIEESDPKYQGDSNIKQEITKVKNLHKELSQGTKALIKIEALKDNDIIRTDTIYFDTNINIFKLILKYMIMFAVILVLIIVVLSFISILILLYDIIMYIINLFINPYLTKAFSIDYLTKNMIFCNKNNYKDDRYLLFSVQSQNLSIFTITAYIFYLLLALLLFYLMHILYASANRKILKGSIYDIDKEGSVLIIFIIIFIYSIIHLIFYKLIFKPLIFTPYKDYNTQEIKVDKLLEDIILIKTSVSGVDEIIVDNNFFDILFDLSRIDELNTIFLNGIKDNNASGCLEQKIIIYDLYIYLKEHISFDINRQKEFKEYCTSTTENKPLNLKTNAKITFISLLNNSEVRMIKKYHEDLDFYNNISDENIEYYNLLNKSISIKLKNINENIITYNKTLLPFFIAIIYIFGIFLFTFGLFYILINYILIGDANLSEENKFNFYFVYILYQIKVYLYDKIIKWFI
jgi:hypothetical protein